MWISPLRVSLPDTLALLITGVVVLQSAYELDVESGIISIFEFIIQRRGESTNSGKPGVKTSLRLSHLGLNPILSRSD